MTRRSQGLLVALLVTAIPPAGAVAAERAAATQTYVANAENQTKPQVRYTGNAWTADQGGFLLGTGRGHRLLAALPPAEGDFRIEAELALPRAGRESELVLGADSELVLAPGAKTWRVRGRFFRAAETAVEFPAPAIQPGRSFVLAVERTGTTCTIRVNGTEVHRSPCAPGALSALGFDPGTGAVHLFTLTATGRFAAPAAAQAFGNAFGVQLRRAPAAADAIFAPVILRGAHTNESAIVRRRDGALEIYAVTKPASDSVSVQRSTDGGLTWDEPAVAFPLPGRAYYAVQALEAADGAVHVVAHVLGEGPGGYRGRLYEVHHAKRAAAPGAAWTKPQRVVPGYVGSIRGFIQLGASGRLLLAVGRAIPAREHAPSSGPDFGWNDTFVYFSDDQGATWRESPDALSIELKTANVTRYGAVEPVLLELRDRVWMLVRDRGGRLWQTFSRDGERWPPLERSPFISSDSPAGLLRLRDGRIVLLTNACQNWSDPRSYAMGGREVLHAAISADEGRTWRGFREILHETNVVSGGDRGSAYPSLTENAAGRVVVVSGQGEGKRAIVGFAPGWLEETAVRDELAAGPVAWTQYGDEGLRVEPAEDGGRVVALPLKASGLCGAAWNFPIGADGEVRLRLQVPAGATALRLSLNDHFNRVDDRRAAEHAVFSVDGSALGVAPDGRWREVALAWRGSTSQGEVTLWVDGREVGRGRATRPAQWGVNYLRVEFRATSDRGSVRIAGLSATVQP